MKKDVD